MIADRAASPAPTPVPGPFPAPSVTSTSPPPAAAPTAVTLRPERPGLRPAGVPVARLVAAEVLLAAAAIGVVRRDAAGVALAVAAAVVLVLGLVRVDGRSPLRTLAVRAAYSRRRRRLSAGPPADAPPGLIPGAFPGALPGALAVLSPTATTSVDTRPGLPLGVLADEGGWTAVLALDADEAVLGRPGPPPVVPGAVLAAALAVDDIRLAAVQLLVHTVAAPDHRLPGTAPAAVGYRQLPAPAAPAARSAYLVLRLEPARAAEAITARGGDTPGACRSLRRVALRLLEVLDAAGMPSRPVTADALPAVVARLVGTGVARHVEESRAGVVVDGLEQVTWRVEAWPDGPAPVAALAAVAAALPAVTTTVGLTVAPGADGSLAVRAHLRTADRTPDSSAPTEELLTAWSAAAGLRLRRLDAVHGPGLLATLPRTAGAAASDGRAHLIPAAVAAALDVPLPAAGVTLGYDQNGAVPLRLLRSRPTQLALVTSSYVARLLALRAQAVGALVEVCASRPDPWLPVVTAAPAGWAALVPAGAPMPARPMLLRCDDLGPAGVAARPDVGSWQARIAAEDFLPATAVGSLRGFDLVVVQRVRPDALGPLAAAFDLPDELRDALTGLPDDVVAVLGCGPARLVHLSPTEAETRLLGVPVRHGG